MSDAAYTTGREPRSMAASDNLYSSVSIFPGWMPFLPPNSVKAQKDKTLKLSADQV